MKFEFTGSFYANVVDCVVHLPTRISWGSWMDTSFRNHIYPDFIPKTTAMDQGAEALVPRLRAKSAALPTSDDTSGYVVLQKDSKQPD